MAKLIETDEINFNEENIKTYLLSKKVVVDDIQMPLGVCDDCGGYWRRFPRLLQIKYPESMVLKKNHVEKVDLNLVEKLLQEDLKRQVKPVAGNWNITSQLRRD